MNPRPPVVECYRTMIRDRYVCLERWPELWRKWCPGCSRMARVASRLSNGRSDKLASTKKWDRRCVNSPAPAQSTLEVR